MNAKLKQLITFLNERGIPLPLARDPSTKSPSVSLTMMAVSFGICIVGLIGRTTHYFEIDKAEAYNLLILTSSLYFGRKITTKFGTTDASTGTKTQDQVDSSQQ